MGSIILLEEHTQPVLADLAALLPILLVEHTHSVLAGHKLFIPLVEVILAALAVHTHMGVLLEPKQIQTII